MDLDNWFNTILQAVLSGDNEANQEAFNSYNEVITNNPEELALVHFQILSSEKTEQERTLTLILLGRYFSLLRTNGILLSDEVSSVVQDMIISLYQLENLTPNDFNILSNDIFLSARYFKSQWEQLPELLYEILTSSNQIISTSIANCLSDCIYYKVIDVERSFDKLFEYVQNILSTIKIDTSDLKFLSSILQLLYSLANYNEYEPAELYIPIFNELPNILRLSLFDTSIFNIFCTQVKFKQEIFENSYEAYFELFIEILSNPDFNALKYSCAISLGFLISSFSLHFVDRANSIFDILVQSMDQNEISYEISDLSDQYGEKAFFAEHVYDYLKNNAPNTNAYIAFGSSFEGIKSHFIDSNLSGELLSLFEPGFASQDAFTRFVSFNSFKRIITNIVDNDEWNQCSPNILEKTLNAITNEDNGESLLKEIQLLSELLKKFSLNFSEIIESIVGLLDQLTENYSPIEFQNELFQCYKYIADSYKENFLPFSENFGGKMLSYIDNPLENEDLFFNCIDVLSYFNESFPQDFFNRLLQSSFQFLTTVVFDENGNVNEEFSLSDDYRLRIINFFLSCLQKEIINDSFELIETIIKISFNTASKDIVREVVDGNSDLGYVTNCHIFICTQGFDIIGKDQFALISNSIKILVLIFKSNEKLLFQYCEDIIKLTNDLIKEPTFTHITI